MKKNAVLFVLFLFGSCVSREERRSDDLISKLEDPVTGLIIVDASNVVTMRNTIGQQAEVKELISIGEIAGRKASEKFKNFPLQNSDVLLSCYAYIIEKTNYRASLSVLKDFLLSEPGRMNMYWSTHFATHTIKVLSNQADIDTMTYFYTPEQIRRAVE